MFSHYASSVLYTILKLTIRLSVVSLQIFGTFLCEYPLYANNRYAINRTIFFTCEWLLFGIPESYVIEQFMRLTGMQIAEVICILLYFRFNEGYRTSLSIRY